MKKHLQEGRHAADILGERWNLGDTAENGHLTASLINQIFMQIVKADKAGPLSVLSVVVFLVVWSWTSYAQDVFIRHPGESIEDLCKRNLPEGFEFAHPPVQVAFGPSERNVVMLFRKSSDANTNYVGWVLVPEATRKGDSYKKYELPPMTEIPSRFEITVESVFGAKVGRNTLRNLVILYHYHRNGSGDDDGYSSYVYDWSGKSFAILSGFSQKLSGLATAAAIRNKLRTMNRGGP